MKDDRIRDFGFVRVALAIPKIQLILKMKKKNLIVKSLKPEKMKLK